MQSQARVTALLLFVAHTVLAGAVSAQEARTFRGRALDEATRQPIPDLVVQIASLELSAVTGEDGRFQIEGVPLGTYVVHVEHLAYGEHLRPLVVRSGEDPTLVIRLTLTPIALDSIIVQGRSELDQRRQSTGFSMNEIDRPDIESAAREGLNLWQLLDQQMPQVSVSGSRANGIAACVEFRGSANLRGGCNHMAIFMDGIPLTAPGTVYPNIPLNDIERVEAISPGQAGVQYGTMGGAGVLLIETRTGPRANRARNEEVLIGFDWAGETQPYPWIKAFGGSIAANAIGLGLGFLAARECLDVPREGLLSVEKCGGIKAFAAGSLAVGLPVVGSSYIAGWGGETDRSRGRLIPAAVLSSVSALTGYLLWIEGMEAAGGAFLVVGTPLLAVFSDRVFRRLR